MILSLAIAISLSTSSPANEATFETSYEFIAPTTDAGQLCTNNCLIFKQQCHTTCSADFQNCMIKDDLIRKNKDLQKGLEKNPRYKQLKRQELKSKAKEKFSSERLSCDQTTCNNGCEYNYQMCYQNCGGEVIVHKKCIYNCHKVKARYKNIKNIM